MEKAALALDIIRTASGLLALARQLAADDETLKGIVAKAHAEGRKVDQTDVLASIKQMDDASTALEAKLAGT